jgi:hypothetical protein
LPIDHKGPCPDCGQEGIIFSATVEPHVGLSSHVKTTAENRREFLEKNPPINRIVWAITLVAPLIGLGLGLSFGYYGAVIGTIVGLVMGCVNLKLTPLAAMKVRETTRETSSS